MSAKEPISITPFKNKKSVPCAYCEGSGIAFDGSECEKCNGTGELERVCEGVVKIYKKEEIQ